MPTHHDFVRRLLADPADDLTRLVYADWLDEQGDADSATRAEFLRLDHARAGLAPDAPDRSPVQRRLHSLALVLPTRWKAAVSKVDVWLTVPDGRGCCPLSWDRLRPTGDRKARECPTCGRVVAYCATAGQALRHAVGGAVALDHYVLRSAEDPEFARFFASLEARRETTRRASTPVDPFAEWFAPTEYDRRVIPS